MAKVIAIGPPANEAERRVIAHLRDHLPDSYTLIHNFQVSLHGHAYEIDLALLAPHAVYLADTKGTRGRIRVHGRSWIPEGRAPYASPLAKLDGHSRAIKGLITASDPSRRQLEDVYVGAAIILAMPDAQFEDPTGQDAPHVVEFARSAAFFQNKNCIPGQFSSNIAAVHDIVYKALIDAARPRTGPLIFRHWQVLERLGSTDNYTEYRGFNTFAGKTSIPVRLRLYHADPHLPDDERAHKLSRIGNAYRALSAMPAHAGIIGARDFFATDSEDGFVLVTDEIAGDILSASVGTAKGAKLLTLDQKLTIARDLLLALAHTHAHGVVHRNLTPNAVAIGADGHARLLGFEFARAGTDRSRTIADEIIDDIDPDYCAPEAYREPSAASAASDVYSAGVLLYQLFTGEMPFAGPAEAVDCEARFPTPPTELSSALHDIDGAGGMDGWLQHLCAFDAEHRPTAALAAAELASLRAPADGLRADRFVERVLGLFQGELRPLLDVLGNEEVDWLEFKASLLPDVSEPARKDMNDADHHWHVARALVTLANSSGGALLLGVDDDGQPVPLSASDRKNRLADKGWDEFARKVLEKAFYQPKGWSTFKRGKWSLDAAKLKRNTTIRRASLDGQDIVAVVVRPALSERDVIIVDHTKGKAVENGLLLVRQRGDVGRVEIQKPNPDNGRTSDDVVADWLRTRELYSPLLRGLLEQLETRAAASDEPPVESVADARDFRQLTQGEVIGGKYVIDKRLGKGAFGVVYKVIDTLGDVPRVIKLILKDRYSQLDRLKKEYRTLLRVPDHPNVVKVVDAQVLPDGTPYLIFEFLAGQDIGKMLEHKSLDRQDTLDMARQVAAGLAHLHQHDVYHCDIKPQNPRWTEQGVRIIDFNVSVLASEEHGPGGGSRKYLPPDWEHSDQHRRSDLADRDIYSLGITLYEALTGRYPWNVNQPPPGEEARNPRDAPDCSDLAPELADVLLRMIAPDERSALAWRANSWKRSPVSSTYTERRQTPRRQTRGPSKCWPADSRSPRTPTRLWPICSLSTARVDSATRAHAAWMRSASRFTSRQRSIANSCREYWLANCACS